MAISLTSQQQAAVDSTSSKILCLAGAGSGKSRVLVERAHRLAKDNNSESILCLTFTNAAAAEMKSRYKTWYPDSKPPVFKTFHGYCYDLICKDTRVRNTLGYSNIPAIPNDHVLSTIKTNNLVKLSIKVSEQTLKTRAKSDLKFRYKYDNFMKSVYNELVSKNYITFDIMADSVSKLFMRSDESIAIYKKRITNILIDEFQDTSPDQWEFAKSFTNADLFVVADERQAIYAFRGADSSITKALFNDDSFDKILLDHNFRSTKQICNFANDIIAQSGEPLHISLKSDVNGPAVKVITSDSAPFMNPIGNNNIAKFVSEYSKLSGSTALLFRTNKEVSEAVDMLKDNNIPYMSNQIQESDKVNYLRAVLDEEYCCAWLSDLLPNNLQGEFIRISHLLPEDESKYTYLKKNYSTVKAIRDRCVRMDSIRSIYNSYKYSCTDKIQQICEYLDIVDPNVGIIDDISEGIHALVSHLDNQSSNSRKESDMKSLYVGTIHSAKGLEWDNVFLWNVNCYSFKLKSEEDWNLYYVGVTRAKQNLFVFKGETM